MVHACKHPVPSNPRIAGSGDGLQSGSDPSCPKPPLRPDWTQQRVVNMLVTSQHLQRIRGDPTAPENTHADKGEACTTMKWYARRAHRSMQHEHGAHAGVKKVRISQKVPLKSRLLLRLTLHGR